VQAKLLYLDEPERINDGGGVRIKYWLGQTDPVGFKRSIAANASAWRRASRVGCHDGTGAAVRGTRGFDGVFDPFGPETSTSHCACRRGDIERSISRPPWRCTPSTIPTKAAADTPPSMPLQGQALVALPAQTRHAVQKAGFFLFGAPIIALRMVFRELRRGNFGAILGSMRGMVDALVGSKR